jgi:UDP-N-acetylmuramate--alanine ligase
VVTSSAVRPDNPEVEQARELRVPVIPRAEMLAELMRLKYGIAVAGMHGKTTTTSMIAAVLAAGGLDPTVVVGGRVDAMGSNARLGKSHYLVAEADESDRSFLKLSPILAVVTNIDREHMDCYHNMRDVKNAFLEFMDGVPFYGMVVACNDDPVLRKILPQVPRRIVTYGLRRGSDFRITLSKADFAAGGDHQPLSRFKVRFGDRDLGEFTLHVPGVHNVLNATAAIAVGVGLDIAMEELRGALDQFRGVDRRFQWKGHASGITVIDDYGHHPTEVKATLAAARQCGYQKIHVIFQPHRYTRTRDLVEEFATAFGDADTLLVLDIYGANEQPIEGVTAERLVEEIKRAGHRSARYASSFEKASRLASAVAKEGDLILTLGAGNVHQVGPLVLQRLEAAQPVGTVR